MTNSNRLFLDILRQGLLYLRLAFNYISLTTLTSDLPLRLDALVPDGLCRGRDPTRGLLQALYHVSPIPSPRAGFRCCSGCFEEVFEMKCC